MKNLFKLSFLAMGITLSVAACNNQSRETDMSDSTIMTDTSMLDTGMVDTSLTDTTDTIR